MIRPRDIAQEALDEVRQVYGSAIGRERHDLVTPALILDLAVARSNIAKMADWISAKPADLRPHVKVHKSPQLARMQIDAGAIGLSTATVWEAAVMVGSGLDGVFVINTVAGRDKVTALTELARNADVMVAVDDAGNVRDLSSAASSAGSVLGVLIEIDTGMGRSGLRSAADALTLARTISNLPGLRMAGLTGYEGHCSLTPDSDLRHERQQIAMRFLIECAEALRADGHHCPIVSAGGTATWDWTAAYPGVTEIQAGSYALMDTFHGAMVGDFEPAITVLTTVISRSSERIVCDAGNKSVGLPELAAFKDGGPAVLRFDEEHGIFDGTRDAGLRIGNTVELVPGYAPGTVNLYDAYHVVEGDRVVDIWPIVPRGPGHAGLLR